MFSSVKKPDLLVYLHSNLEKIKQNISKRGRKYEQEIMYAYQEILLTLYNKFLLFVSGAIYKN